MGAKTNKYITDITNLGKDISQWTNLISIQLKKLKDVGPRISRAIGENEDLLELYRDWEPGDAWPGPPKSDHNGVIMELRDVRTEMKLVLAGAKNLVEPLKKQCADFESFLFKKRMTPFVGKKSVPTAKKFIEQVKKVSKQLDEMIKGLNGVMGGFEKMDEYLQMS